MSSQPLNTPGEAEDDELVAYLDGELDAETARRLEQRLEADQQLRRKYRQMAVSWDLLDQLPRAKVDDAFTRHTVETVAIAVSDDVQDLCRNRGDGVCVGASPESPHWPPPQLASP